MKSSRPMPVSRHQKDKSEPTEIYIKKTEIANGKGNEMKIEINQIWKFYANRVRFCW